MTDNSTALHAIAVVADNVDRGTTEIVAFFRDYWFYVVLGFVWCCLLLPLLASCDRCARVCCCVKKCCASLCCCRRKKYELV